MTDLKRLVLDFRLCGSRRALSLPLQGGFEPRHEGKNQGGCTAHPDRLTGRPEGSRGRSFRSPRVRRYLGIHD